MTLTIRPLIRALARSKADPDVRAVYQERAAKEGKGALALARSDYFKGKDLLSK